MRLLTSLWDFRVVCLNAPYIGCITFIGVLMWWLLPLEYTGVAQGILANAVCFAVLIVLVPVRDVLMQTEFGRAVLKAIGIKK
jgi:hypothetical protein